MSSIGDYTLSLYCDHRDGDDPQMGMCERSSGYTRKTRFACLEAARADGWLITRKEQAYCPDHADSYRAMHRYTK